MKNGKKKIKAAVCAVLFAVLLFDACALTKAGFGIFEQKRDNPIYFAQCLSASFDAEKSEAVTQELAVLTEKALTYAAMKGDVTLFENYPYVQSELEKAERLNERERADTLYFALEQIKDGTVSQDMAENGFIVLSQSDEGGTPVVFEGQTRYARIDEKRIDGFFAAQLSSRQEEIRLASSTAYREAKEYLDSLETVSYAVCVGNETVSNRKLTFPEAGASVSGGGKNAVYVKTGADSAAQSSGSVTEKQKAAVQKTAGKYAENVQIYLEFSGSMLFTKALESTRQLHDECRKTVTAYLARLVLSAFAAVVLLVMITVISPVSGQKKKGTAAALVCAVLCAALTVFSVSLFVGSVKLFFNPTLDTTWLTVDSGSIVTKACIRACLIFAGLSGFAVSVKAAVKGLVKK